MSNFLDAIEDLFTSHQNVYFVKPGDTIKTVSAKFYGSSEHWSNIFRANRHIISANLQISPGQKLFIPHGHFSDDDDD